MGFSQQLILVLVLSTNFCVLVTCADKTYLQTALEKYFSKPRHEMGAGVSKRMAKEFIYNEFKKMDLQPEYQTFDQNRTINATFTKSQNTNVIGIMKGAHFGKPTDRPIAIAAHYDTDTTKFVSTPFDGIYTYKKNGEFYCAEWTIDKSTKSVTFNISAKLQPNTWMAVGINKDPAMSSNVSDAYIAWMDNTVPVVSDRHPRHKTEPAVDAIQNVRNIKGHVMDGLTSIQFTRDWSTGDAEDYDLTSPVCAHFTFAWGGPVSKHGDIEEIVLGKHALRATTIDTYCLKAEEIHDYTPGVDDNGSGVVAMLDVAKQLSEMKKQGYTYNNTIIFVAFDNEGETDKTIGSKNFVPTWIVSWLVNNYKADAMHVKPYGVFVLDSIMQYSSDISTQELIGNAQHVRQDTFRLANAEIERNHKRGDFISVAFVEDKPKINNTMLAKYFEAEYKSLDASSLGYDRFKVLRLNFTVEQMNQTGEMYAGGDQAHFWDDGIAAVLISDTGKYRGSLRNCTFCDTIQNMTTTDNLAFLAKTVDALFLTVHKLSDPSYQNTTTPAMTTTSAMPVTTKSTKSVGAYFANDIILISSLVLFCVYMFISSRR